MNQYFISFNFSQQIQKWLQSENTITVVKLFSLIKAFDFAISTTSISFTIYSSIAGIGKSFHLWDVVAQWWERSIAG